MPVPMLDLLQFIDEVAHLDPDPRFIFQTYHYEYRGYGWTARLEIHEGEATYWSFECDGVLVFACQRRDDPIEFILYPSHLKEF